MSNEFTREPRLADGIGKALAEARERAGISTAKEFAGLTGLTQPKISRIEGGKVRPRPDEIEKWAQAANLNSSEVKALLSLLAEYDLWRSALDARIRYGVAGDEIAYTDTFKATKKVRSFAVSELPAYLQIEEYAHAAIEIAAPDAPEDERAEAVQARIARAEYLRNTAKHFEIVLAESALRWLICEPDLMRSQLGHLHRYLSQEHIDFWVLPMGKRPPVIPRQGFTVHDEQFVVVDLFGGAATFRQQAPRNYGAIMDRLTASAVRGDAARDLLSAAIAAVPVR